MGADTSPIWMRNGIKESMTPAFSGRLNALKREWASIRRGVAL
jgi:hypothetical protein